MPKSLKTIINFTIFLAIGLGLIWLVTHNLTAQEKEDIIRSFRKANYWLIIPVIFVGIASHWYRAVRWKLLMEPLGYHPSTLNTFFAVMVGYLANLAIPRLGEVTRCGLVARYENIPAEKLVGTMIAERAVDMLVLLLLMLVTVVLQLDTVGVFFTQHIWVPLQAKLGNAGSSRTWILAGILIVLVMLGFIAFRIIARSRVGIKIKGIFRGVWEGVLSIGKMKKKGWFIFYSLFIWALYFTMMYLGFLCMDETRSLGVGAALSVLCFGSIGMIATQGGIGAYQILVQQTLLLYGIHATTGYAFGWIVWLAQTLMVIVMGFASLIALPVYNKSSQKPATE
ncbi:lysylphosphatidylglycerol synthase transmembrane domain-containing protein [Chitinophaga sp.]|uniref:lysylphosphatidylglycerol synthase transmembrane domain-containing protein n=1 Tax=Chitinophaga sp. TaxID=1869181 RepID=UPI0031CDFE55